MSVYVCDVCEISEGEHMRPDVRPVTLGWGFCGSGERKAFRTMGMFCPTAAVVVVKTH